MKGQLQTWQKKQCCCSPLCGPNKYIRDLLVHNERLTQLVSLSASYGDLGVPHQFICPSKSCWLFQMFTDACLRSQTVMWSSRSLCYFPIMCTTLCIPFFLLMLGWSLHCRWTVICPLCPYDGTPFVLQHFAGETGHCWSSPSKTNTPVYSCFNWRVFPVLGCHFFGWWFQSCRWHCVLLES